MQDQHWVVNWSSVRARTEPWLTQKQSHEEESYHEQNHGEQLIFYGQIWVEAVSDTWFLVDLYEYNDAHDTNGLPINWAIILNAAKI